MYCPSGETDQLFVDARLDRKGTIRRRLFGDLVVIYILYMYTPLFLHRTLPPFFYRLEKYLSSRGWVSSKNMCRTLREQHSEHLRAEWYECCIYRSERWASYVINDDGLLEYITSSHTASPTPSLILHSRLEKRTPARLRT